MFSCSPQTKMTKYQIQHANDYSGLCLFPGSDLNDTECNMHFADYFLGTLL